MPGQGLSLRYKILLILTLLPLLALGLYLVVAVGVFKKDKLAYVFDSTSAVASTLASQVTTDLNSILGLAQPMIQEHLLEQKFSTVTRAILDSSKSFEWISAYEYREGRWQMTGFSETLVGQAQRDTASFGDVTAIIQEARLKGRTIRVPYKDDRILIAEKVGAQALEKVYFILAKVPDLAASFRAPGANELYLINSTGFILFGPVDSGINYVNEKVDIRFLFSESSARSSGTREEGNWLISYASPAFSDLKIVSLVSTDQAFSAVADLILKSVLFFVLLLSATTIVSLLASKTLTSALSDLNIATRKVSEGDFDIRVPVESKDEVGNLAASFNTMAEEVSRLLSETAEKARMQSELQTAQTVQETLFPPSYAEIGNMRIRGFYEPASECGGDWWHYCQVGDKVYLWIGDATGHGAPAALITSAAKSAATIIERLDVEPGHAMTLLNRAIYDVSKGKIMMTFFLAQYDLKTRKLIYSNASHEAPFLIHKQVEPLKKKDLVPLNEVNSPRLGQDRDTQYEQTEVALEPGDRILFYTDGIPDINSLEKEAWGERNFIKAILATNTDSSGVDAAVDQMVDLFSQHRNQAPLVDDITFFMTEVLSDDSYSETVGI